MRKGLSSKAERMRPSSALARRPEESYLTLPNRESPSGSTAATDPTSKSNQSFSGQRNKKRIRQTGAIKLDASVLICAIVNVQLYSLNYLYITILVIIITLLIALLSILKYGQLVMTCKTKHCPYNQSSPECFQCLKTFCNVARF